MMELVLSDVAMKVVVVLAILIQLTIRTRAGLYSTMLGPTLVKTGYGRMRGTLIKLTNPELPRVEAYLGLQYASLVVNNTRFSQPTSPLNHWDNIRPFTAFQPVCPQVLPDVEAMRDTMPRERIEHFERLLPFLTNQQEDCLYLNIYVPFAGELVGWLV